MKLSRVIGAVCAFAWFAAAQAAEVDQIAQQKMIGLSKKKLRLCMGPPAHRIAVGSTDIWTYRSGRAQVEGFFLASGVNGMASWFGSDRLCSVNIVMTNARVSQIAYAGPDGRPLPIGEHCDFAVENCMR
jgi:hypothetical protein